MITRQPLYCLSKFSQACHGSTTRAGSDHEYEGQLVFAGPDAAIEIAGEIIRGYVNGEPSHPQGQLAALIDNYDRSIIEGATSLRRAATDTVILAGKWHHVDFDQAPRFEAYLVHVVTEEGVIETRAYRSEIFDWDDPEMTDGRGFGVILRSDPADHATTLMAAAERWLRRGDDYTDAASGLAALEGVIWFPENCDLPIVVSFLAESDAHEAEQSAPRFTRRGGKIGDGTVTSALRVKSEEMPETGEFRGVQVIRKTHRPTELTLDEVFSSTDAFGYWSQTWDQVSEPYSMFNFPTRAIGRGDMVLRKADVADAHRLLAEYASEWEEVKGLTSRDSKSGTYTPSKTRFRILAVGSVPGVPQEPL